MLDVSNTAYRWHKPWWGGAAICTVYDRLTPDEGRRRGAQQYQCVLTKSKRPGVCPCFDTLCPLLWRCAVAPFVMTAQQSNPSSGSVVVFSPPSVTSVRASGAERVANVDFVRTAPISTCVPCVYDARQLVGVPQRHAVVHHRLEAARVHQRRDGVEGAIEHNDARGGGGGAMRCQRASGRRARCCCVLRRVSATTTAPPSPATLLASASAAPFWLPVTTVCAAQPRGKALRGSC